MRRAEKILNILHERGQRQLPVERVYRWLYEPELYMMAYAKIGNNKGALSAGSTPETVDGMSIDKINTMIAMIREERYRWKPCRRVYIPKKNGATRPLGMPTWQDKLLQAVIQLLLEAYYEPQFSQHSHGFRRGRGCHTALQEIKMNWGGVSWMVEGDIKGCFDNINHERLISILRRKVKDERLLRLIHQLLRSGYMEGWEYHKTYSGTPQGGTLSPLLANIYLNELDEYVEKELQPKYTNGAQRRPNLEYHRVKERIKRYHQKGRHDEAKKLQAYLMTLSKGDPQDPGYERLWYVRYADDWVLGYIGSRETACRIKGEVGMFLKEHLSLELSENKTMITHAATERAKFLGYEISKSLCNTYMSRIKTGLLKGRRRRAANGIIELHVPREVIEKRIRGFMKKGKVWFRGLLMHESDYAIVSKYQSELRGLVQYYQLAKNVSSLYRLKRVMSESMLKTLAGKHRSRVYKILKPMKVQREGYVCLETKVFREGQPPLIARFGGFPIRKVKRVSNLNDQKYEPTRFFNERNELLKRLLARQCEVCGWEGSCEVHHVRHMSDLKHRDGRVKTDIWIRRMAELRRKTLSVCHKCHRDIHRGQLHSTAGQAYEGK